MKRRKNGARIAPGFPGALENNQHSGGRAAENNLYLGKALPTAFGGFTNNIGYKNFSLDVLIEYAWGNKVFNANRYEEDGMYDLTNQLATTLHRWRNPGDKTDIPLAILGENSSN